MSQGINEADTAAVTETVRTYYDGMMAGDEAKLARAFHPRACIVGKEQGELYWATLDEFVADCKKTVEQAGPTIGASMASRSKAIPPWSGSATGMPACGTATICP